MLEPTTFIVTVIIIITDIATINMKIMNYHIYCYRYLYRYGQAITIIITVIVKCDRFIILNKCKQMQSNYIYDLGLLRSIN